jgi:two-component system, OmpR family, response regulator MprA
MNDFSRAPRVLVVEDDEDIAQALQRSLRMEGYEVRAAADGPAALEHGRSFAPDLVILDLGLPGLDGLEVARSLRAEDDVPILILTARDALESRVEGLDAGADDYLVKPFAVQELIARLRALTRRGKSTEPLLAYADLTLDLASRTASRSGRPIELTGREAALLELLLRETGHIVSRERALSEIWSDAAEANVVDRYVTRLRRKLGDPPLIRTLRGAGFVLRA